MKEYKTAIILCGGKGTRLGNLGKRIPKTLVKVQGKEILWYILKVLAMNGFNHIILPIGYRGNLIKKFILKNKTIIPKIDVINTGVDTSISKRIFLIRKKIRSKNFLILNGDAIFSFNIKKYFFEHSKFKKDITFFTSEITYPFGTIGVKNKKILDFNRNLVYEAVGVRNKKNYLAYNYSGMSIINLSKFNKILKKFSSSKNFEKDVYSFFIKNYTSDFIKLKGFWHSIDNLKDIDFVNNRKFSKEKYNYIRKLKRKLKLGIIIRK